MAIYDLGTASLAANGEVTGVGTTWKAPLTLIRVGATIVFKTEPVQIYTILEIISDTKINVYNPNSETVPAGTGYAILAHDGITVQGLAQDVAETLRYYQSQETVVAGAIESFESFDFDKFNSDVQEAANNAATSTIERQRIEVVAANVNTDANLALGYRNDSLSYSQQAKGYATDAQTYASNSNSSAQLAESYASNSNSSAQLAESYAQSINPQNYLRSDENLSKVSSKVESANNISAFYYNYPVTTSYGTEDVRSGIGFFASDTSPNINGDGAPFSYAEIMTIAEGGGGPGSSGYYSQIAFPTAAEQPPRYRQRIGGGSPRITNWRDFLIRDFNTTVDNNGFLKIASPIVKVFGSGSFEVNSQAEGCHVSRLSIGVYKISGCTGLNSEALWGGPSGGFEIPVDINKQPRIWLDYSVDHDGAITIKTFHRTHGSSPSFASNHIEGFSDGDPIDIPDGCFVSVRVNV